MDVPRSAPRMRVGVDIASAADVRESIETFGDRYLDRIFTPHEREVCQGPIDRMATRLAARFAAKEAVIKVLRPHAAAPNWRCMEVRTDSAGWSDLVLTGAAHEMAQAAELRDFSLSMSHDHDVATAVVVAVQEGT